MATAPESLAGKVVALPETRQLDELDRILRDYGATTVRCPLVRIVDNPDTGHVRDWLDLLTAGKIDYVVLMTGEALRRLVNFADKFGVRDRFVAALAQARKVTRGPKPVRALAELKLKPDLVAESPTTEGVIAVLKREKLQDKTVGVTLFGEANPSLDEAIRNAGAMPVPVMPYVYAPECDNEQVASLIRRLADGDIDAIAFTSSPQVDRLFEVAEENQLTEVLRQGLERTCVAAVGPVVRRNLENRGIRVDVCPTQGFVMKNLVRQLARHFADGS